MAKKPAKKPAKKSASNKTVAKKKPAAKASAKKPAKASAKKPAKASAKKPAKASATAKPAQANAAVMSVLKAAAAVDWSRASKDEIDNVDKQLGELVTGKPAARAKAYAALDELAGRPLACVIAPFLVDLAVADGARVDALRLLAAMREQMPPPTWRRGQRMARATAPIASHLASFLANADADVRAASALVASTFEDSADGATLGSVLAEALARETDARAKACFLPALWVDDVNRATRFLDDPDSRVAAAAACALARADRAIDDRVIDLLERALGDTALDTFPFPDRPLRDFALSRLSNIDDPAKRDRLAALYGRLLDQPPAPHAAVALLQLAFPKKLETGAAVSDFQRATLRQLLEAPKAAEVLLQNASEAGLSNRPAQLRRLAGIREPVPSGWVLGVEITVGGVTDSALGFWKTYDETGEGNGVAIAKTIADALSPEACAQAILEGAELGSVSYSGQGYAPPPIPPGGVLGAIENWESWTVYKGQTAEAVCDAYERQLVAGGWHILGRSTWPTDTRLLAIRDGVIVDGTFYWGADTGAYISIDAEPNMFTTFVDAALARHGKAFVDAYNAIGRSTLTKVGYAKVKERGNIGFTLPQAALLIAQRTNTPPDPSFDHIVADHQRARNVLLAGHMSYLALVPQERRDAMIVEIISDGEFMELAREARTPTVIDAAVKGFEAQLNLYRSGYDPSSIAGEWTFLGDHAVTAIQKALAKKKVGNPDIAAEILARIGTPAARAALGKLAKHPDKNVQKIVQAALTN